MWDQAFLGERGRPHGPRRSLATPALPPAWALPSPTVTATPRPHTQATCGSGRRGGRGGGDRRRRRPRPHREGGGRRPTGGRPAELEGAA
jgi:hypothetical protein